MQGLLQAALVQPLPAPLSSTNLASHTLSNPPASRRTVTLYILQQAPYVSRTALEGYEVGPPPSDEFEEVKTPPKAREAGRKRTLEDIEGYESGPRKKKDEALVLHVHDGHFARPRAGTDSAEVKRKKPLLAMQLKGRSSSTSATPLAGPSRPPGKNVEPSPSSSFLVPRAGTLDALDATPAKPSRKGKRNGKENEVEPVKKASPKRRKGRLRAEAEEADELDEVEERLRARRERRRERALIRKDRTITSAAVGVAAASKVKAAHKKQRGDHASSNEAEEEAKRKSKRKRASKDEVARRRMLEIDKPSGVKAGRLTLKPTPQLGIFNKGKASVRTRVGNTIGDLAFSELAFLDAPRREPSSPSSASTSSSSSSLSRSNVENLRPTLSAARPRGTRTYGSGRRGSARASKHFAALVADEQPASSLAARPQKTAAAPMKIPRARSSQPNFWIEIPSRSASSLSRQRLTVKPATSIATDDGTSHPSVLSAASLARRRRAKKDSVPAPARGGELSEVEEFPRPTLYGPLGAAAEEAQDGKAEGGEGDLGVTDVADHDGRISGVVEATREASETEIGTASLARMLDEVGATSEGQVVGLAEDADSGLGRGKAELQTVAGSVRDVFDHESPVDVDALADSVPSFQHLDSLDLSASFADPPTDDSPLPFKDGFVGARADCDASTARRVGLDIGETNDFAFPISSASSCFSGTAFHDVPTLRRSLAHYDGTDQGGRYADEEEFRKAMRRQWPKARC